MPEWPMRRLSDLVSLPNGQVDPQRFPYSQQVLIAPDHVESGTGRLLESLTASEQGAVSGKYIVHAGDVVYSKIRPALRKATIAKLDGLCSADMYPMTPSLEIDSRYLLAVLVGENFSRFAESVSGRTQFPKLNRRELGEYSFPLPSLIEQRRITQILESADLHTGKIDDILGKLELWRTAAIRESFAVSLRDGPMSSVGEIFAIKAGITLGPDRQPREKASKYLRVANVQRGRIDLRDVALLEASRSEQVELQLMVGDLLVVEGHANPGEIGRCALVGPDAAGLLYQNHLFRLRSNVIDPEFAELWLNSDEVRAYWRRVSATSSGLYTINSNMLRDLPFPVVSRGAEADIIASHRLITARIRSERGHLTKLQALKQGLMEDLLSGRVRVPIRSGEACLLRGAGDRTLLRLGRQSGLPGGLR
jgi:type I restriction enzyme, S subunit